MDNFMILDGRVAVVTGGRRGIGLAIAELLTRRGANIMIGDRTIDESIKTAQIVAAECGCRVEAMQVGVSDFSSANALIEAAMDAFGRVDILVNNAGVTRDTLIMRMTEEDWDF